MELLTNNNVHSNSISNDVGKFVTDQQAMSDNSNSTSEHVTGNKQSNLPNTSTNMEQTFPDNDKLNSSRRRYHDNAKTNNNTRDRSPEKSFGNMKKQNQNEFQKNRHNLELMSKRKNIPIHQKQIFQRICIQ